MAASSSNSNNVEKDTEEIHTFTPDIELKITRTALICVSIANIEEYWQHNTFDLPIRSCLLLFYCFNDENHSQKSIEVGRLRSRFNAREPIFFLKPPLFLCGYKLTLSIAAKNTNSDEWMDQSKQQSIDVPSIWCLNEYKVGDGVVFRGENEIVVRDATIIEILSDNKYKLKYKKNNDLFAKDIETVCDGSKIYNDAPNLRYTIDLANNRSAVKHLFLKRNDPQSMDCYNAIKHTLELSSTLLRECVFMYGFDFLIHLEPIIDFLSYNVIGYLFEPSFTHSVRCLFDVTHSQSLKFVNEMQYLHEISIEMGGLSLDKMEDLHCSCDLCRTGISEWSFMFVDQTCIEEAHHYCLNCILSTIVLNKELKDVLHSVLKSQLNMDCINEIVNCLIGCVVYTDLECKKTNKRNIDDVMCIQQSPNQKRRKLNCDAFP